MQLTVNTRATEGAAHKIDVVSGDLTVQNLGAGNVYLSRSPDVAPAGPGLELGTGDSKWTRIADAPLYLTADADGQDVRIERL